MKTTDDIIDELRLAATSDPAPTGLSGLLTEVADRLDNLFASGIHTCHADCQRPMCVLRRERDKAHADLARVTAERDALLNNQELIQARIATYERALVQYANSINWMTHTDDAADDIRRVWVGSDDGRNYAREALEDGTAYEMNSDMDFYEIHPPHSRDGIV